MGLEVGFVDDVDPVLVAQVVEAGVVGVVAGADRVGVVELAEADVGEHVRLVERAPFARVELMAVDALEDDAPPVERHDAVVDSETPEPDVEGHRLARAPIAVDDLEAEAVEGGGLGGPRRDPGDRVGHEVRRRAPGCFGAPHGRTGVVEEFRADRCASEGIDDVRFDAESADLAVVVEVGVDADAVDVGGGQGREADAPEQAVETPGVLSFEPRGAGVLVARDDEFVDGVRGRPAEEAGDVELTGGVPVFAVADERAVAPDVERRGEPPE